MLGMSFCFFSSTFFSCSVQKHKDSELKINNGQKIDAVAAIPNLLSIGSTGEKKSCSSVIVEHRGKIFLATALHCVAEKGDNEKISLRKLSLNFETNNSTNNSVTDLELDADKKLCFNKRFFQLQHEGRSLNQAAPYDLALLPLDSEIIETQSIKPFLLTSFRDSQHLESIYQPSRFNPLPNELESIPFQAEGVVAGWGQVSLGAHLENEFSANFALAFERSKTGLIKAYSKYLPGDSGAPFLVSQHRPISDRLPRTPAYLSANIENAKVLGLAISYGNESRQNFLIDLSSHSSKALFEAAAISNDNPKESCEIDDYTKYEVNTNTIIMDEDLIGEGEIAEVTNVPESMSLLAVERIEFSDDTSCVVTNFNNHNTSWSVIPEHCVLDKPRHLGHAQPNKINELCDILGEGKVNCSKTQRKNGLVFIKHVENSRFPAVALFETSPIKKTVNLITFSISTGTMQIFEDNATLTDDDKDCPDSHIDFEINLDACIPNEHTLSHPFATKPSDSGSPLIVIDSDTEEVKGILCIHQGAGESNECTLLGPSINSLN